MEKRTNSVDMLLILRAFACLLVILCHTVSLLPKDVWLNNEFGGIGWIIFSPAWTGMWIFFVLSGYLMGKGFYTDRYSGDKHGLINFYINRALRILPLYYFSIFILMLFVYPEVFKTKETFIQLFQLITFTFNGDKGFVNGPLWSISTEYQYYLTVPFLFIFLSPLLKSKRVVNYSILLLLITGLISRFSLMTVLLLNNNLHKYFSMGFQPFIANLDLFLIGFLVNPLLKIKKNNIDLKAEKVLENLISENFFCFFAVFFMILLYFIFAYISFKGIILHKGSYMLFYDLAGPFVTAIITAFFIYTFEKKSIIWGIKNQNITFKSIKQNPLRIFEFLGILTYGLYIWHGPILLQVGRICGSSIPILNFLIKFSIVMVFGIILATITYITIEKPLEKFKKFNKVEK